MKIIFKRFAYHKQKSAHPEFHPQFTPTAEQQTSQDLAKEKKQDNLLG